MTWDTEDDLLAEGLYEFYEHDFYEIFKFSRHLELNMFPSHLYRQVFSPVPAREP